MIVGLKNASLVVVTTLVLIFSMATTFFPWEDVKKGGEISGGHRDASQKKAKGRWTHMNWRGKKRRGMELLLVSLGRTIKTMISSTNVIIFSTDTVRAACGAKLPSCSL